MRIFHALLAVLLGVPAVGLAAQPAAWSARGYPSLPTLLASRSAPAGGCGDTTPAALGGFFDGALPSRLDKYHVPGAVVSVVADGQPVFAKGYGRADAAKDIAFDPSTSLVRIASITKLFTWTAVMQQVEAGKLDLNTDVNQYLKSFKVPATYPEPVTLLTLMNHTAGFEERVIGTGARRAADVPPLGDYLAANMPARIRPPGEIAAYSNYGAALAGYIVSQVSGEPYDRYVQRHIFEPLGMAHSTATEPIPAALAGDLARSYDSDTNPPRPIPFTFDPTPPEGAISTTAGDISKFMLAHLGSDDPALTQMHETSFTADPRLGGLAHGFMERTINGHRVLLHDGSWEGFQSVLLLVPDCHLGLFESANATGGIEALSEVLSLFYDRFSPIPAPTSSSTSDAPRPGFYQPARHNETTVEKLTNLLGPLRLRVGGDGTVQFGGKDWKPQGNGLYGLADGSNHLVFLTRAGRHYVATDGASYQLMSRGETLPVNLVVLLAFVLIALTAIGIPLRRRSRDRSWRLSRSLAAGAALLGLAFLVGLGYELLANSATFLYGVPFTFRLLMIVPVLVLLAGVAALVFAVRGWRTAGRAARIHQVTLFAALAAFAWFLGEWNLIGWQF